MLPTNTAQSQEPVVQAPEKAEEYVIWVKDRTNVPQIGRTEVQIRKILGPQVEVEEYKVNDLTAFWVATFKASLVATIGKINGVEAVEQNAFEEGEIDFGVEESDEDDRGKEMARL